MNKYDFDKNAMSRIAAIMYAENSDIIKSSDIVRKIIQSIIVNNDNELISIEEIVIRCKQVYLLDFTENEISRIVNNSNDFLFTKNPDLQISLTKEKFLEKKEEISRTNIDLIIDLFTKEKEKKEDIKRLIYGYLYKIVNESIISFKKSLNENIENSIFKNNSFDTYNEKQNLIINEFINWEHEEKNKILFNLFNFGLEYCLITSNKKLDITGVQNKCFYLDTNIIFSAIGINGKTNKKRIINFLKKCKETKSKFFISSITDKEIKNTIDKYISDFQTFPSKNIDPSLFEYDSRSNGFLHFYNNWKIDKLNIDIVYFNAYLNSLIYSLYQTFKIKVEEKLTFITSSEQIREEDELIQSIKRYKREKGRVLKSDVDNYLLVKNKRKNTATTFFDVKYFFITNDHNLRRWDSYRSSKIPIILLPHQWLSFILKFYGRTNDDFTSFVSYLNINNNHPIFPKRKLNIILSAISELTNDFEQQRFILESLIRNNFNKRVKSKKDEDIYKQVGELGADILSDKVKQLEKSNISKDRLIENNIKRIDNLEEFRHSELNPLFKKITIINKEVQTKSEKIKNLQKENKVLENTHLKEALKLNENIKKLNKEKEVLKKKYIDSEVEIRFSKWKRNTYLLLIPIFIFFTLIIFSLFGTDWKYNLLTQIFNHIDTIESQTQQSINRALIVSFLAAFGYFIKMFISRLSATFREKEKSEIRKRIIIISE